MCNVLFLHGFRSYVGLLEGTVDPLSGLKSGPNFFRGLVQFGPLSE